MSKTKAPKLSTDEAKEMIRRRIREWKKVNPAREKLAAKEKKLRADIEGCLVAMRADEFEASDVKAQLVRSSPVKTKDTGNVEFLRKELTPAEFEELCPRALNARLLGERRPELVEGLAKGSKRTLRMDYVQEPAPQAKGA